MGAIPAWVEPPPGEVADLHWLAWRAVADTEAPHAKGVERVLAWVSGQRPLAPMSGRLEQPVTRRAAESEFRVAGSVPIPAMWATVAAELGVAEWTPEPWHPDWAEAVYQTLRWLLGVQKHEPPMQLPARHADGSTLTAEELYESAVREQPWLFSLPEQRVELRLRTERDATRHRRLAALIADTKRQHGPGTVRC